MSLEQRITQGALLFATALFAGCVGRPAQAPFRPLAPVNVDRQLLARDEILGTQFTNLFEVIRALRGNWLRVRSADSFAKSSSLQVYVDAQRVGGTDELRTMVPSNVYSVRYLDPLAASARWGMDHGAGAILVTTSRH